MNKLEQRYIVWHALAYLVLSLALAYFLISWIDAHDALLQASAIQYEDCVRNAYSQSPVYFYQEHGYYPECNEQ